MAAVQSLVVACVAYFWYISLPRTSIPANNAIYQSSAATVYVLSAVFLGERLTIQKTLAVAISIAGVVLVSVGGSSSDSSESKPEALGYVFVVLSVLLYSVYEVLYARVCEPAHACPGVVLDEPTDDVTNNNNHSSSSSSGIANHDDVDESGGDESAAASAALLSSSTELSAPLIRRSLQRSELEGVWPWSAERAALAPPAAALVESLGPWSAYKPSRWADLELSALVLGLIGLFTLLLLWPVFFALHSSGVEPFVWPVLASKWRLLAINAALDSCFNTSLLMGILLSSPLVISVGAMLVVPVSIIVDFLFHGTLLGPISWVGVGLIVAGFVVLKLPSQQLCCCARQRTSVP